MGRHPPHYSSAVHSSALRQRLEALLAAVLFALPNKPVCRRVALKVIKLAMDTKGVVPRFEAERQALAMMS